jgi:hypothetical protein
MEVPPDILTRRRAPFPVTRRAFQALPATVQEYYFRGCEKKLVKWLLPAVPRHGHRLRLARQPLGRARAARFCKVVPAVRHRQFANIC